MKYYNEYPMLRSPILKKYKNNRTTVIVNQLFAANKNQLFYGPQGHSAWDLQTMGALRFIYHNVLGFVAKKRISEERKRGIIPVQATHGGIVLKAGEDSGKGRYVRLLSDEVLIQGRKAKIETLSYHLNSLKVETGQKIRRDGVIVGYTGNTGKYTTGPHIHFGVRPHWKLDGSVYQPDYKNGYNGYVDPLPYMTDGTIYQRGTLYARRYFQYGEEKQKQELIYLK